jgi:hypothetical protein
MYEYRKYRKTGALKTLAIVADDFILLFENDQISVFSVFYTYLQSTFGIRQLVS